MNRHFGSGEFSELLDPRLIPASKDPDLLWNWLESALGQHCGVKGIFYLAYPVGDSHSTLDELVEHAIWRTSYPEDYLAALTGSPLADDYSARHVLETGVISRWHDPESPPKMSKGELARIHLDERYNMAIGACFPIYTPSGRICGGFGLRSQSQVGEEFDAMLQKRQGDIARLLVAFDQQFRGPFARTQFKLSAQEVRVLAYLAGGMAVQRVAHVMSLSPKTIEAYMGTIRRKTASGTTAEAVAKAVFFNLI